MANRRSITTGTDFLPSSHEAVIGSFFCYEVGTGPAIWKNHFVPIAINAG
ncbi:hypothetical protein [Spirosoma koreense]